MKLMELLGLTRLHIAAMAGLAGIILLATLIVFLPPAMPRYALALGVPVSLGAWMIRRDLTQSEWPGMPAIPHKGLIAVILAATMVTLSLVLPRLGLGLILFGVFYLPIHLPFLVSFALGSHEWRETRSRLRLASIASIFFVIISPPGLRSAKSDSIGEGIEVAMHNTAIHQSWLWSGSMACVAVALTFGLGAQLCRRS
jgi:hypothetical protein